MLLLPFTALVNQPIFPRDHSRLGRVPYGSPEEPLEIVVQRPDILPMTQPALKENDVATLMN